MAGLIGVLGGTFDPPHLAHLRLAYLAVEIMGLEKVLWVVTGVPPHKPDQTITPDHHRLAMVELTIASEPNFEISFADLERPSPHYSLGTIRWLRDRYQGKQFAYLMGGDSLIALPTWHQPAAFLEECSKIGVLARHGFEPDLNQLEELLPGIKDKLTFIPAHSKVITGREIRRRVRQGEPYRDFLPPEVADYIHQHRLYQ